MKKWLNFIFKHKILSIMIVSVMLFGFVTVAVLLKTKNEPKYSESLLGESSISVSENVISEKVYSALEQPESSEISTSQSNTLAPSSGSILSTQQLPSLILSSSLSPLSSFSSSSSSSSSEEETIINYLVQDPSFKQGFKVRAPRKIDNEEFCGYFDYDNDNNVLSTNPIWLIAPWFSKYSIGREHNFTKINEGYYRYEDVSKKVEIDINKSMTSLRLDASKEYTEPRKSGEAWPHLLIEQSGKSYSNTPYFKVRKISDMKEFRVTLDTRLTHFNDAMGDNANPALHGCGFYIYLYVQNLNRDDAQYGQMIWFGLPFFDNRYEWCPEYAAADGGKEDASGMFIYQIPQNRFMPSSFWRNGHPSGSKDNDWVHIDFDCMEHVKKALRLAHDRNFLKNTTIDDLYFNGFNIGWEMYGTYDGEIQVKNFQVMSILKNNE